jgi:hypothetical protein
MALTFSNYYALFQDIIHDDSATTLVKIKQMINAAYKAMLAMLPTYWTEKSGTFTLTTNATSANLPADCFRVISVDYPSGNVDTFKPTIVTQDDWMSFRQPVDEVGQPEIFYPGGYTTTSGVTYMKLYNFPGCSVTYSGTYRVWYHKLPGDMSDDNEVPVFDDRWQDLLQQKCRVQAWLYDGKVNEAAALDQLIQQQMAAYMSREDTAHKKEAGKG